MVEGKVRSLITRPYQSSDLAFEVSGVLDWQHSQRCRVGANVSVTETTSSESLLRSFASRGAEPMRAILFDAEKIQQDLGKAALFRLRNHQEFSALKQTILQRDIQHSRFYRHSKLVAEAITRGTGEQLAHLEAAKVQNKERHEAIQAAYQTDQDQAWKGVRKTTQTVHTSKGKVISDLFSTPVGIQVRKHSITAKPIPAGTEQEIPDSYSDPTILNTDRTQFIPLNGAGMDTTAKSIPAFFSQRSVVQEDDNVRFSVNQGNEFWHPRLENDLEFSRLQSTVSQDELRSRISALAAQAGEEALLKEFEFLELEVLKSQTRLLNTYLLPSFDGVITAIYKDVGEYVHAGEPVLRLENMAKVFLVGFIQLRALPVIGNQVTIKASAMYEIKGARTFQATIVSVRGHNVDDDEWELLLEMDNSAHRLPPNFGFDPDTTTVTIT